MQRDDIVPAKEFCVYHNIQLSFIHSLMEYEMIQIVMIEEGVFLPVSEVEKIEKMVRLYFELNINLEGIETITHLLERIHSMQQEIVSLTNRLKAYEA